MSSFPQRSNTAYGPSDTNTCHYRDKKCHVQSKVNSCQELKSFGKNNLNKRPFRDISPRPSPSNFVSSMQYLFLCGAIASFLIVSVAIIQLNSSDRIEAFQSISSIQKARKTRLAGFSMLPLADTPAESARCLGLLHACQSWLALKDGVSNDIVITSPGTWSFFVLWTRNLISRLQPTERPRW